MPQQKRTKGRVEKAIHRLLGGFGTPAPLVTRRVPSKRQLQAHEEQRQARRNEPATYEMVLFGISGIFAFIGAFAGLEFRIWFPIAILGAINCGVGYAIVAIGKDLAELMDDKPVTRGRSAKSRSAAEEDDLPMTPLLSLVLSLVNMPRWQRVTHICISLVTSALYAFQIINLTTFILLVILSSGLIGAVYTIRRLKKDLKPDEYQRLWQRIGDQFISAIAMAAFAHPGGCSPKMAEFLIARYQAKVQDEERIVKSDPGPLR